MKIQDAPRYDVVQEYGVNDGIHSTSPGWFLAVFRLARPVTYSRSLDRSTGDAVSGALLRRPKPLIIFNDCLTLNIQRSCGRHTKTLSVSLRGGKVNYLSANAILPGDWVMAWCHNDIEYTKQIINKVLAGEAANDFNDGLKFVGRIHNIRKNLRVSEGGKVSTYSVQAIGFSELDTSFYYDVHLAEAAAQGGDKTIAQFMANIGLDFMDYINAAVKVSGNESNNMARLIPALIDSVVGKGGQSQANKALQRVYDRAGGGVINNEIAEGGPRVYVTSPAREEAPYSYLVPSPVAKVLGKEETDKSRQLQVFAYADILHLLIGVQRYDDKAVDSPHKGFWPIVDPSQSTPNRSILKDPIKGTFIPQGWDFINIPVWQMIAQQFLNPAINMAYTALKVGPQGKIIPTIVVRQIPFSTNAMPEREGVPLTRFLHLPRWVISPSMVTSLDIGRSDATKFNMVKILGDPKYFPRGATSEPANELVRNPPVFDTVDIARFGLRPYTQIINCTPHDVTAPGALRAWTQLVADWTINSQYTLNGTITCKGIQTPIAEGDNIEFEDMVYHIEAITDSCIVQPNGAKIFNTTLSLANGMPVRQSNSEHFPTYPGFEVLLTGEKDIDGDDTDGDDLAATTQDPGVTDES